MALTQAETQAPAVKVVEQLRVSPPPASVLPTTLPLTYFDVPWLAVGPVQRLFFYQYDGVYTDDFLNSQLPGLRCSLSLALQTFFTLAGSLAPCPETGELVIAYADGDSVALLVAESDADFASLVADDAKDVKAMHPFVPPLPAADERGRSPLLAVQVTIFPGAGFCLGVSIHHAVGDGRSSTWFIKSWAAINRSGGNPSVVQESPIYDRAILEHLEEQKRGFLQDLERLGPEFEASLELASRKTQLGRIVRSTFVLTRLSSGALRWCWRSVDPSQGSGRDTRDQINKLRNGISSGGCGRASTFVVACLYVWLCLTKARKHEDKTVYFTFFADCRRRLDQPVPDAYFGNCIGGVSCTASGAELAGGADGLIAASKEIQAGIQGLDGRVVEGFRAAVSMLTKMFAVRCMSIAGSPRFRVYETDFGWGPPKKVEIASIESTGAMSLAESRGGDGGIEIGLVAPEWEMKRFATFFKEGLINI